MSYDSYRMWLKGMKDADLNDEIGKLQTNAFAENATQLSRNAWKKMLDIAVEVQKARDAA